MKRTRPAHPVGPLAAALALASSLTLMLAGCATPTAVAPVPGGTIGTLPIGDYICETGGDALGPVGNRVEAQDFSVVNASSYRAHGVQGTYLLTGDFVVMTTGGLRGNRYHRLGKSFLRLIGPDGKDSDLRCVERQANNG